MSKQSSSVPAHLIDFSSQAPDGALPYQHRIQFGDVTLTRGSVLPTPGIYLGSEQAIVARHCGTPVRLDWRSPDSDALRSASMTRGTIHIKSAGQCFWQRWSVPADVLVIAFERTFFANLANQAADRQIDFIGELGVKDPRLDELTALFNRELLDGGANGRLYTENLAAALAVSLVQRRTNNPAPVTLARSGLPPARLRRVLEFIDAHLANDLSLSELSEVSGLNPHHFAHAFKASTGMPPHRYIIEKRISKAQELLQDGRQSIAEVAFACGFASQSHLTQHFHRIVRTTPAKFRRSF